MAYEATGNIKIIFDTQTFPSGFLKREFVVTVGDDNYPQDLKFEIIKDKCEWLDKFRDGQQVTVHFDIRGNEFKDKYYVNLNCWKITSDEHDQTQESAPAHQHTVAGSKMPQGAGQGGTTADDSDIPFNCFDPRNLFQ